MAGTREWRPLWSEWVVGEFIVPWGRRGVRMRVRGDSLWVASAALRCLHLPRCSLGFAYHPPLLSLLIYCLSCIISSANTFYHVGERSLMRLPFWSLTLIYHCIYSFLLRPIPVDIYKRKSLSFRETLKNNPRSHSFWGENMQMLRRAFVTPIHTTGSGKHNHLIWLEGGKEGGYFDRLTGVREGPVFWPASEWENENCAWWASLSPHQQMWNSLLYSFRGPYTLVLCRARQTGWESRERFMF